MTVAITTPTKTGHAATYASAIYREVDISWADAMRLGWKVVKRINKGVLPYVNNTNQGAFALVQLGSVAVTINVQSKKIDCVDELSNEYSLFRCYNHLKAMNTIYGLKVETYTPFSKVTSPKDTSWWGD